MAIVDPESDTHLTLFRPQWFFDIRSSGYGLGHSIGYLFRGGINSLDAYLPGIPAVAILAHRVIILQIRKLKIAGIDRGE